LLFLSYLNETLIFWIIYENTEISNFMDIRSVVANFFHGAERQTDGRKKKMLNSKVSFYGFSKALAINEYPSVKVVWNGPSGIVCLAPNFNPRRRRRELFEKKQQYLTNKLIRICNIDSNLLILRLESLDNNKSKLLLILKPLNDESEI